MRRAVATFIAAVFLALVLTGSLAWAAENPPGLLFSTLLNGVKMNHNDGKLRIDDIQAVFLPDVTSNSSNHYDPDTGGKLWTILRKADGTALYRLDWYAEKIKDPFWLLNSYRATDLGSNRVLGGGPLAFNQPGDYVLDFHLSSGLFYAFPFSLVRASSSDPLAGECLLLSGAWEKWGYFYYADADPQRQLLFKIWLHNNGPQEKDVRIKIEVKNQAGKLVCTSRPGMTQTLAPEWNRFEYDLISPMQGTSGGAMFTAGQLLAKNGSYTLKLTIDGNLYGTWSFQVAGGKLVYSGRTLRGKADPLTFVEGGRDAWWYEKQ